ncbi:hypothetical protein HRI_000300100 [Hibiscus trionum]|uniref:HTH myb-type domain-containing protein n=1 Tax=Hibiscus trionum TaxID=183268 RepID=A0A9W7GXC4_HIBTR|nr:hypothetical protein HRI_000300100 [Hibiscus trionum]
MGEISSEVKSVSIENDEVSQNPGEFKRLVGEKQVLAGHQGDVNGGDSQDGQQIQVGENNELLAPQETQGPSGSTPVEMNDDHVAGNEVVVKEKPILMVTNELKPRLRWTLELHDYFLEAVNRLGGPQKATPKAILDMMDLDGLHLLHIKSHLQKFRLGKFSVKDSQDTSKNASQLVGGPQSLRPLSSVPYQTNQATEYNRRRRAKRAKKSKKERRGKIYMQLQAQARNQWYPEAQRYLNTTPAGQHSDGAAIENAFYDRQPSASLGTFTTMPGPSDFGMVAELPQFYVKQQNTCPPTYDTRTGQVDLGTQEVPVGYQPKPSNYPAPGGFSNPNGCPTSSNQETLPVLPSSEVEMIWPDDEDLIEALLNWDDDEPVNLDFSFNYGNLQHCLS